MTTTGTRIAAVAAAAVVAVGVLLLVVPSLGSRDARQGDDPAATSTDTTAPTPTTQQPPPPTEPSAGLQVVAAGMRTSLPKANSSEARLWVRDSVCERWNDYRRDPGDCTNLTAGEMADLERLLPSYVIGWVPGGNGLAYDTQGMLRRRYDAVSAAGGSVFVYVLNGPRSCLGAHYEVRLREGPPVVKRPNQTVLFIC